ncbi:enoyl-CoA delta isomerase 2-like isoform X1 [Xenia sp. Carnegie-2017]|uniref:enoyl-CoA delta isomerase 2-like isoform X1 n=1 Tax=Xenia sp. Carnegie-2017 TaxID=2897299 RepID=UPI001F03656F|nr:enoyl-CoA delta isomerase 2-like isoform X1 [Xenia sp. Carnegie-2017]
MNVTPRVCKLHAIFRRGIVNYLSRPYLNLNIFTKMVRKFPAISHQFKEAKDKVGSLIQDPGNELKLKMYALFKQGSLGKCNTPKPGTLDFVGKAKWNAWNDLSDLSQGMRCYSLEKKLTAVEACNYGLVTEVIPQAEIEKKLTTE